MIKRRLVILTFPLLISSAIFGQHEIGLTFYQQNENDFGKTDLPPRENPNTINAIFLNYQKENKILLFQTGITYFRKRNVPVHLYSNGGMMYRIGLGIAYILGKSK